MKYANLIDRYVEKNMQRHEAAIQHQVDRHQTIKRKREEDKKNVEKWNREVKQITIKAMKFNEHKVITARRGVEV